MDVKLKLIFLLEINNRIRLIDSLNYLPMSLAALTKAVDLPSKRTTTPAVRTKSKKTKTTAAALPDSVDTSAKDISHHSEYEATPLVSPQSRSVNLDSQDNPPKDDAINALSLSSDKEELATVSDTIADDLFISSDEDEDVIIVRVTIPATYTRNQPGRCIS
ncbi:hypothetical protein CBL_12137 [Carabus blaptoides fortunei]